MARIRTIKPEFFDDPDVIDLSMAARLLFIGLWTQADRRGRLLDEPRRLKIRLMPGDDVEVNALLDELSAAGALVRYEADGRNLIWIRNFERHQQPHMREAESVLAPYEPSSSTGPAPGQHRASTGPAPDKHEASPPVSGSGNGSGKDPVCGSGKAGAKPPAPHVAPRLSASSRRDVAFPGRPPVPAALHQDLRSKLGGDEDVADTKLREWYGAVSDAWENKPIGDDDWTFWRARFQEWIGTTRAAPGRPTTARPPSQAERPGVWGEVYERLEVDIGAHAAFQWFGQVTLANDTGSVLTLALPSDEHRDFLARRYGEALRIAAELVRPGTIVELFVAEAA